MFRIAIPVALLAAASITCLAPAQDVSAGAKAAAADPYAVPQTNDTTVLADFIEAIVKDRPATFADVVALNSKMPTVMEAAERILRLETDKSSKPYRIAQRLVLRRVEVRKVTQRGTPDERKALLDEVIAFVSASDKTEEDAWLALNLASSLEYAGNREMALAAYEKLGRLLASSADANAARIGRQMQGVIRRSQLVGQTMELKGKTLDSQPFDLASLRGKVVLVDFWATNCGPCVAEIPIIKREYEQYRTKGFEVVGVSLDREREALVKFVATKNDPWRGIPWITVYDDERGEQHPVAIEYGIFGIPTMILLDREGKVVSTTVRGEELSRLLKQMLAETND
jgi:thiol-disulfide isomerase/thioredoxin